MNDQKKINVVEMAKKKRHIHLYEKIQKGARLTRAEIKELKEYESKGLPVGIVDLQEDVAAFFKISARTVRYWIKDGMPITREGVYDLQKIQEWRLSNDKRKNKKEDKNDETDKSAKFYEQEYRKYKAELAKIEYEKKIGELLVRSDVEAASIQKILAVKTSLLAIPKQMTPQLVGLDAKEIEGLLKCKLEEVIKEFAGNN